jgi:SAM-dependent methyltransferase
VLISLLKNLAAGGTKNATAMEPLRLNLGCGAHKLPNYLNVDKMATCAPDAVVDIERLPWPWPDDSVEEVILSHVLEHIGRDTDTYLGVVRELWRVCRHGARIHIAVPHPRHDNFLDDPTHVRAITPDGLRLFSQRLNREWAEQGAANTPLGLYLGVDFEVESVRFDVDEPWYGQALRGEITEHELAAAAARYYNVVSQIRITLRVEKPDTQR